MKALILVLAAALTFATPAAAQVTDSANAATWVGDVCPGTREMLIATTDGERMRGYCGPIERTQLRVSAGAREQVVPFAAVDSIWVRQRGAGRGAATGALAGALLVGGAGVFLGRGFCETENFCLEGSLYLGIGGAALGGVAGALLGAAGGHVTRGWRRIYPY